MLAPTSVFVGTVKFIDVSSVAAETAGKIKRVTADEGAYVAKGNVLAVIDSELLDKSIAEAEAGLEQTEANLQLARNDFDRTEKLYQANATSEQSYDNKKYTAISLEKQKAARMAAIANLKTQAEKKNVYAPFDGIVVAKKISDGEWANAGSPVADIARTGVMDILVNVPENLLGFLAKGLKVSVDAGGRNIQAAFYAVIPSGDVANRTFPVKFRTSDAAGLLAGMEAKVSLPTANPAPVIFVNRDAVVKAMGNVFVYTVNEGKAAPLPVQVLGYDGQNAGVTSSALKAGIPVIIKGNERLRPDQPVNIIGN